MLAKLVIALACHAGDHGFESRTSRKSICVDAGAFFLPCSVRGQLARAGCKMSGLRRREPDWNLPHGSF